MLMALCIAAASLILPPVQAAPYRVNGIPAPQVQPNPAGGQLQARLKQLQQQFQSRARPIDLRAALQQSLAANPILAQAYSQIQASQWDVIAARREWYPKLDATAGPAGGLFGFRGGTTKTTRDSQQPLFRPFSVYTNSAQAAPSMALTWTFFNPSRGPTIAASGANLRSQELLFNVSARQLVLDVQLAYFSLQEQRQLLRSYEQILEVTNGEVARTEALFNSGTASIADVEQIRTQQYQNLSLLIATYDQLIAASAALAEAMALPPGTLVLPEDNLSAISDWPLSREQTLQQALALREEIQASLAQAASANWVATALFNRYWPRFSLGGQGAYLSRYQVSGAAGSSERRALDQFSWDWALGVGFSWSIFDGGINAAQAESDQAKARQFEQQAAIQRLQVAREVETAYATYVASQLALISTQEQAASARKAANAIQERYKIGFSDMTTVVQMLNQAITAANAFARAKREYNDAVVRLYRYSSEWPEGILPLLKERANQLEQQE